MCLGVGLFASILFGTYCAPWIHMSISFTKLGNFSFIIFSIRFPISSSFSSSSTLMIKMLVYLKLSQRFLSLSFFFWILFSSPYSDQMFFFLPYVPNHWFDSWLHPLQCWFPVNFYFTKFFFISLYFSLFHFYFIFLYFIYFTSLFLYFSVTFISTWVFLCHWST